MFKIRIYPHKNIGKRRFYPKYYFGAKVNRDTEFSTVLSTSTIFS